MRDFFEYVAVGGQQLEGFRSSFHRSGFESEWPDVDEIFRAQDHHRLIALPVELMMTPRAGEEQLSGGDLVEHSLEADLVKRLTGMDRGLLHDGAYQVIGNLHHLEGPDRHRGASHGHELHSQGGLDVAEPCLDFPAPGIKGGDFHGVVFHRIQQRGDDDNRAFLTTTVLVAELDVTQCQDLGKLRPL